MSHPTSPLDPARAERSRALRAFGFGLAVVGVPLALGTAVATATQVLAVDLWPAVALGFAGAALAVAIGVLMSVRLRRSTAAESDPQFASQRMQVVLGGGFVAKLALLGLGFGALSLAGLKFEFLLAFALAFAGAAASLQIATVLRLFRPGIGCVRATKANAQ